jgi:hypothetical protein
MKWVLLAVGGYFVLRALSQRNVDAGRLRSDSTNAGGDGATRRTSSGGSFGGFSGIGSAMDGGGVHYATPVPLPLPPPPGLPVTHIAMPPSTGGLRTQSGARFISIGSSSLQPSSNARLL